jgi:hypothetical protein
MNKSTFFSGQPTFYQLIKLIPKEILSRCVEQTKSDRYRKSFFTWDHLVAMLFTCYGHCQALREVVTGMKALEGKLLNLGIRYFPAKSTLADANAMRDSVVFERIFFELKAYWDSHSPDSRTKNDPVYIIDSTTIKLFQEIFRGAGSSPANGKRKGGLKVHMAVEQSDEVPSIVHLTQAAYNDGSFTKYLNLPAGSTVIMDRGYKNYNQFNTWTTQHVRWVTRIQPNAFYRIESRRKVTDDLKSQGIRTDWEIVMGAEPKKISKVKCRLIKYTSEETGKKFEFITNDFDSDPITVADLYRKRWKIELLFKRLKQNMPLRYFLGDNKNAIRIQIWCALIADLLVQVVRRQIKRKWAFSNIVSLIRLHLFNYLDLFAFLENPESAVIKTRPPDSQLKLNLSG